MKYKLIAEDGTTYEFFGILKFADLTNLIEETSEPSVIISLGNKDTKDIKFKTTMPDGRVLKGYPR